MPKKETNNSTIFLVKCSACILCKKIVKSQILCDIISNTTCLTLGLLRPLTPFYYSSAENRGCESPITHWWPRDTSEPWRQVWNFFNLTEKNYYLHSRLHKCSSERIPSKSGVVDAQDGPTLKLIRTPKTDLQDFNIVVKKSKQKNRF